MVSTERARTFMDSSRDNRHSIAAATQVDRHFDDYTIEMTPEQALSFVATAPVMPEVSEAIYAFVDVINRLIPPTDFGLNHPRTGRPHHKFRVGRRHGDRVLVLELFKGFLQPTYPFDELVETIRLEAEKAGSTFHWQADENAHEFTFLWPSRSDQ